MCLIRRSFPADFRFRPKRPVPASRILKPVRPTMQLEFHQLDRRWEHLRVRDPQRQRRLLASLADSGQQTPIVVVVSPDNREHYQVIDGYKSIAAPPGRGHDCARPPLLVGQQTPPPQKIFAQKKLFFFFFEEKKKFPPPET